MAVKMPSEAARAREMYKYAASQVTGIVYQDRAALVDPSTLRSSRDTVLTGLAQLAVLRLNAARVLISLFDERWQYVIAEATPNLSLAPATAPSQNEQILLCGTAVPRSQAICEAAVALNPEATQVNVNEDRSPPVVTLPDLAPTLASNPYFKTWPHRSFASVSIQSPKGISIGALSIFGDAPRDDLDETSIHLMRDLSRTIMGHLDCLRAQENHRRANRMVRGVGTLIEGHSSLAGWQGGVNTESFRNSETSQEGALNANQQSLQNKATLDDTSRLSIPSSQSPAESDSGEVAASLVDSADVVSNEEEPEIKAANHIFSKAANVLRESIEVQGVLFLDASISSFGGIVSSANPGRAQRSSSSSSSDDSMNVHSATGSTNTSCRILGFSNSSTSSIDGNSVSQAHSAVPEGLLRKLIKRHPRGKIFNFDENGLLSSGDSSSEEHPAASGHFSTGCLADDPVAFRRRVKKDRSFSKKSVARLIIDLFPGSRSVAFVPAWDSHKQRWFAGGFIYTKTATRVFTPEGELSYFSAYTTIAMAEFHRTQEVLLNKTKTDLLGSISHELRSPLHGVVLGAELLQDTELDIFQRDVLNSIENCSRTLIGTIDHLLDWTKINKFKQESRHQRDSRGFERRRGMSESDKPTIESGMMSRTSDVDVAVVAEQVVESMFAGHNFQTMSIMRMLEETRAGDVDMDNLRALDSMQAVEAMASHSGKSGDLNIALGGLVVILSVDAGLPWIFETQPGAIRRILMNLVGNSLKFTTRGFVEVRLEQESVRGRANMRHVTLTVADSGRGIDQEFLRHQLFRPFTQEDTLVAGAGLGLSLTAKIVHSLGGSISAESKVARGTTLRVKLPLRPVLPASPRSVGSQDEAQDDFRANVAELRGLRVIVTGYPSVTEHEPRTVTQSALMQEQATLTGLCVDWLNMEVINPEETTDLLPDLFLCGDQFLDVIDKSIRNDLSTPTVVICRSALIARQLTTSPKYNVRTGVGIVEFISQPLGPRKLAKVLHQCFKRWTRLQEATMSTQAASDYTQTGSIGSASVASEATDGTSRPYHGTRQSSVQTIAYSPPKTPLLSYNQSQATMEPGQSAERSDEDTARQHQKLESSEETSTNADQVEIVQGRKSDDSQQERGEMSSKQKRVARFLLVDDNSINLKILSAYMRKLGRTFETACNGLEALEKVKSGNGKFKCIMMDISMPIMDGFEATRHIRTFERERKLPRSKIYALTGLASASAQQEAFASGIDLFLTKPVTLTELSRMLAQNRLEDGGAEDQ